MPTAISDINVTVPADPSAADQLAAAVRQLKSQLVDILNISLNDDGTLKIGVLSNSGQIGSGVIGSDQLAASAVQSQNIAPLAITSAHLAELSVLSSKLGNNAVTEAKIAAGAVTETKLGDEAVTAAKVKAGTLTATQIADTSITDAKISSLDGAKLNAGTVTADRLKYDAAYTTPRLPVVGAAAGSCKIASIGGALTATLVGDVLTFALSSGVTDNSVVAEVAQTSSGGLTASSYTDRVTYSRLRGENILEIDGNYIKILTASSYLVLFWAPGHSCGLHKCLLTDDSNVVKIVGTVAYADVGQQTYSFGCGLLNVEASNAKYKLRHWASVTRATDGQGRAVGDGSSEYYAKLVFIGLT